MNREDTVYFTLFILSFCFTSKSTVKSYFFPLLKSASPVKTQSASAPTEHRTVQTWSQVCWHRNRFAHAQCLDIFFSNEIEAERYTLKEQNSLKANKSNLPCVSVFEARGHSEQDQECRKELKISKVKKFTLTIEEKDDFGFCHVRFERHIKHDFTPHI